MNHTNKAPSKEGALSYSQKIAISGMMMALYVVTVYLTQSFSFGAYQIRIATAIYAMAYFFPFLILPLGAANCLSNLLFGGLGIMDVIGGFAVGVITTSLMVLIRRLGLPKWTTAIPIILAPGFGVPIYLHILLNMPYWPLTLNLLVGQAVAGAVGALIVITLSKLNIPALKGRS